MNTETNFEEAAKSTPFKDDQILALSSLVIHTIASGVSLESTKRKIAQLYAQNNKEFDVKTFEKLASPEYISKLQSALIERAKSSALAPVEVKQEEVKKEEEKPKEVEVDFSSFF